MTLKRTILTALAVLSLTGCVFSQATVSAGPDAEIVQPGPLADVETTAFTMGEFVDARAETGRIGYRKTGFGGNAADIVSERPVGDVVRDAIVLALERNGHGIADDGIVVSAAVQQFWVEIDQGFTSIEVSSTIEADVSFSRTVSGEALYSRLYRGSFKDNRQIAGETAFNDVVSAALNSLIDEISFDEDLAEALEE